MIIEGDFFFQGMPRWNLGWPTPNYAGAFIATLLPWCWIGGSQKPEVGGQGLKDRLGWLGAVWRERWRVAWLGAEAIGFFLFAKTYSRGALVALAAAALFFIAASGWSELKASWRIWLLRCLLLTACVVGTGFSGRIDPVQTATDGAVVNRLDLWRGGLAMIAAAPLSGWGAGESGRAYMNWFQDVDRTEGYATMVNSYLHVGVEHGLWTMALVFAVVIWLLAVAWREGRSRTPFVAAMGASLAAWAIANVFTTLWIDPRLWIVPAIAGFGLMWQGARCINGRAHMRTAAASVGVSLLAVMAIYGAGGWLGSSRTEQVSSGSFGAVGMTHSGSSDGQSKTWHVWPDAAVLGTAPGKELRRWLKTKPLDVRMVVHRAAALQPGDAHAYVDGVMLFGRQVGRLASQGMSAGRALWLIHPLAPPPSRIEKTDNRNRPTKTVVVLPEIDEAGNGAVWRAWAERTGAQVLASPMCGLDIRARWPGDFRHNTL
ncbi:MAG: O-antigen ligase family protein [Opitutaceae bacterium]